MRVMYLVPFMLVSAPAFSQEAPLAKIYACAGISDSAARLACYDGAVAELKQAESGGDVAVVSRAQIQQAQKEAFGLTSTPTITALAESVATTASPAASAAAPAEKPKSLDRVTMAVKQIEKGADGKLRFVMENGQVWRQTDTTRLVGLGKGPWEAEVRRGALGSFMLKVGERTPVRVKRVE